MPETSTQHGKSFDENIDILFDELVLAAKWGRPSVLLAVHKSRFGQDKAEKALEARLEQEGLGVARIVVNDRRSDIPALIRDTAPQDGPVFFVSNIDWGGGEDGKQAYRALNMHRELFIEGRIKAVFWLTTAEAANLPRYAPDFWAFRHRVVEFVSQRATRPIRLPAGVLLWDMQKSVDPFDSVQEGIRARQELLERLPKNTEALSTRLELYYSIGYLQWTAGDAAQAAAAFRAGLELAGDYDLPELKARLLNGMGIVHYEAGEYTEALDKFNEGLQYRSSSRALLINRSAANCMLGRHQEAAVAGKKAIRVSLTDAESWNRFGYIQAAMGKPDEAISCLVKATEIAPRMPEYHEALATLYSIVDRPDEAARHLMIAIELRGEGHTVYTEIVREAILGDAAKATEALRLAEASKKIGSHLIRRDANLALLLDEDQIAAAKG